MLLEVLEILEGYKAVLNLSTRKTIYGHLS